MTSELSAARLAELEAFALDLARAAGAAILPLFRADHGLEDKGGPGAFDPVTAADKGAEAAIRDAIAAHYPDHGVLGEEFGEDRTDAEFVWVLEGEVVLVTDAGEHVLTPGDVVIQVGSWHQWSDRNFGSQMAFVMMAAPLDE